MEKILSMATPDEFSHLLKPFLVMALPTPQGATVSINSFLIAEENIHRAKTRQCISSSAYLAMFQVFRHIIISTVFILIKNVYIYSFFVRNDRLVDLMIPHLDIIVSELLGPLYRGGELFWNPTVNKMTALVLQRLIDLDKDLVLRHADRINIGNLSVDRTVHSEAKATAFNESKFDSKNAAPAARIPISRTGLPRLSASLPRGSTPHPVRSHMAGWSPGQGTAPPVTVTGVAPWAQPPRGLPVLPNVPYNYPAPETEILRKEKQSVDDVVSNAQTRLFGYICRCKGLSEDGGDASNSGTIDWLAAQAAQTPTLLPDLKFHQLVFGRELGQGAFSIVKYARHIQPNKTRSQWPEYAVKVMSKRDLEALGRGFQDAAVREIAALSVLSHPGIARLISAFRYTDSIYLVLEYAAAGDLHSYIMVNGALNHYYTRFVMGEVGAALVSIHDMGLSFNDLKPENVLITENGHVKLTDFGACRPINESGQRALEIKNRELIRCIAKKPSSLDCSFFDHLRDGDWRETTTVSETANEAFLARSALEVDSVDNDLNTIEGTPGYLPPEVLRDGCIPDQLSDSWAFGCTMSFCLEGRPPFYGHTEQVLHQIYLRCQSKDEMKHSDASFSGEGVHFKEQDHNGHHSIVKRSRRLDGSNKADVFQIAFDDVMGGLLSVDFTRRKKIEDAIKHNYFTGHDIDTNEIVFMNPFQLHSLPPLRLPRLDAALEGGSSTASAGPVDKEWARRQLSSVWAPMPKVYDFSQQKPPSMNAVNNTQHVVMSLLGAIIEGLDEKNGAFLPATKIKHSRNTEFRMQPPVFE